MEITDSSLMVTLIRIVFPNWRGVFLISKNNSLGVFIRGRFLWFDGEIFKQLEVH